MPRMTNTSNLPLSTTSDYTARMEPLKDKRDGTLNSAIRLGGTLIL